MSKLSTICICHICDNIKEFIQNGFKNPNCLIHARDVIHNDNFIYTCSIDEVRKSVPPFTAITTSSIVKHNNVTPYDQSKKLLIPVRLADKLTPDNNSSMLYQKTNETESDDEDKIDDGMYDKCNDVSDSKLNSSSDESYNNSSDKFYNDNDVKDPNYEEKNNRKSSNVNTKAPNNNRIINRKSKNNLQCRYRNCQQDAISPSDGKIYCKSHLNQEKKFVNCKDKFYNLCQCGRIARYDYEGESGSKCGHHKKKDMIVVNNIRFDICLAENCQLQGNFHYFGEMKKYCLRHSKPGMIHKSSK